jgi:transcription elongation factor GreA
MKRGIVMEEKMKVTKAGKLKLEEELKYLKETRRKEVVEQIKTARGFGDLSENSEYDEAKNEQGKVEARIVELEEMLKNVTVIEDTDATGRVRVGSSVKVFHEKKNAEVTYQMVGANEVDYTAGKISDQSPIGKALLGAQAGETVDVYNIDGVKLTTLKVLEIAAN